MTGTAAAVWQISAGPAARSYADVFLKHGVALIGPGDAGPWTPERGDEVFEGSFVRRFARDIADGDIVLLRTGLARIAAVGIVVGGYEYANAFDDVNGWDLQHARRVRWARLPSEHEFSSTVFGADPPRCSRVWHPDAVDYAKRFVNSPPTHWQSALLPGLPRTPQNCRFVIEAKRLGAGVEAALEQAQGYVAALGGACDVIVTDGIRYRLYDGRRSFAPVAYANLARLKQSADKCFARLRRP